MTDPKTPAPHPTAANDHPTPAPKKAVRPPAPKATHKAEPRPAPRPPIPKVPAPVEVPQSKGKIAAMVGVTLTAGALIGRGVFGVASKMLGRGR